MLIGIIGAPNKGKSTLFSALTLANAEIADYPFTTIKPNYGVAYVAKQCPEKELHVKCNPKNSTCTNGVRYIPINIVDIAGLVPGAHLGKGMGNQFLTDAIAADVLVQVVDASGKTDLNGNHIESADPSQEVSMVFEELSHWVAGIIKKHMNMISKRKDGAKALSEILTGLKVNEYQIQKAMDKSGLILSGSSWKDEQTELFSSNLVKISKPIVVCANKSDITSDTAMAALKEKLKGYHVVECSAALELALKKASKTGIIDYVSGSKSFNIVGEVSNEQRKAIEFMKNFVERKGTGIQELLNCVVVDVLKLIAAYPVEDENKYTDHFGNVLPDARFVENTSTALDLARTIHTDLAKNFLYAIDAKKKMRISKEQALKDGDVIKIVSAAK